MNTTRRSSRSGSTASPADPLANLPQSPPETSTGSAREPEPPGNDGLDRGDVIANGLRGTAAWSARFIIVVAALTLALWLLAQAWVGVFPIIMAIIVSTVMWPVAHWLVDRGVPAGLSAIMTILLFFGVIGGVIVRSRPRSWTSRRRSLSRPASGSGICSSGYPGRRSTWTAPPSTMPLTKRDPG